MGVDRRGLYHKYDVKRTQDTGDKHKDCKYFVLDLSHDPFAVPAIRAYAEACRKTHPVLSRELMRWVDAQG